MSGEGLDEGVKRDLAAKYDAFCKRLTQNSEQAEPVTVLSITRAMVVQPPLEFAWTMYRQVLHREPRDAEVSDVVHRLQSGAARLSVLSELFRCPEADVVYLQPYQGLKDYHRHTIASIFRRYYLSDDMTFVHAVYEEILHRNPDEGGLHLHVQLLNEGTTRSQLASLILHSSECESLVFSESLVRRPTYHSPYNPVSPAAPLTIGFFLAYPFRATFEGEGISMFTARLAEGLLLNHPELNIVVATTALNRAGVDQLFDRLNKRFGGQITIQTFESVESLNQNASVHVWIVPYIGLCMTSFLDRPYIVCLHDLVYRHFPELYDALSPLMIDATERTLYSVADRAAAVVSQSEFVRSADAREGLNVPPHKAHVIRFAAPTDEYRAFGLTPKHTLENRYGLHVPYLLYPSALRLHKNHIRLLQAFAQFRQTPLGQRLAPELVLTDSFEGNTLEAQIHEVLAGIGDEDIRQSIRFIGRVPSADIPSLYRYATGVVAPTLFEGSCPFPILESVSVGTPVAASDIQVTREVVLGDLLTFDPYSVEDMASAIETLCAHPMRVLTKERRALRAVLRRSWKDVAREYYDLIQTVLT